MQAHFKRFAGHFGAMVRWNAAMLAFALPALLWTAAMGWLLTGEVMADSFDWALEGYTLAFLWLAGMIPLGALADVGTAGTANVFCRLIGGEDAKGAFFSAVRRRGIPAALLGALRGVLLLMLLIASQFYAALPAGFEALQTALRLLMIVIWLMVMSADALLPVALLSGMGWRQALMRACEAGIRLMPSVLAVLALTMLLPGMLLMIPWSGILLWSAYYMVLGLSVRLYANVALGMRLNLHGNG